MLLSYTSALSIYCGLQEDIAACPYPGTRVVLCSTQTRLYEAWHCILLNLWLVVSDFTASSILQNDRQARTKAKNISLLRLLLSFSMEVAKHVANDFCMFVQWYGV